ncbi:MAG TPA: efflux RND transporter periplasmic adaptor subunit [Steroidobacteraceae bacterium]|nr:efflux RND transporter periplasmic adaptor subunit [Steroidobacteraceae bacterium]
MSPHDHQPPDEISRTEHQPVSTEFDPDTGRRVKRGATVAGAVLLALFLMVAAVRFFDARALATAKEKQFAAPPGVDVVVARAAKQGQDLVLPGQTAAWYETTIYARVSGYVAKWSVDIGDHVSKGQVLATIETPELDAELAASKAQLQASEAQVVARKAEAEFGKTTNERWRDSPKGVVSDQEREAKNADYKSAEARLYAANAQVALDKSRVDQYRAMAEFKQVKAPFDGTITERKIDVGNLVTAGSASTTTPLYRISQTDPLRIFVDVPQSSAGELMNAGVPAQIRATGSVAGTFAGKTARSAESMNPQARTMRVEVDMPNATHALLPGMYVNVAFALRPRGLVEVPAAALIFRAQGAQVAVVDPAGKIRYNDAVIARDNGTLVELASGAQPGDRLVLNISSQIQPGEAVTVNNTGDAR